MCVLLNEEELLWPHPPVLSSSLHTLDCTNRQNYLHEIIIYGTHFSKELRSDARYQSIMISLFSLGPGGVKIY